MSSMKRNSTRPTSGVSERPAAGFELLDHPCDLKLRVWGPNLAEIFVKSAEGMMAYLFGSHIGASPYHGTEDIKIDAPDPPALLVDWLSELLYRATSEYHAYVRFRVHELGETMLKATADTVAAEAIEDIKAVTHHELSIRENEHGWEATVVFDI